jgi:hypothetical protein
MTRDELTDENRRMNAHDRGTFQRWMITNTVVGTIWAALLAVFAITSLFSGTNASNSRKGHEQARRSTMMAPRLEVLARSG